MSRSHFDSLLDVHQHFLMHPLEIGFGNVMHELIDFSWSDLTIELAIVEASVDFLEEMLDLLLVVLPLIIKRQARDCRIHRVDADLSGLSVHVGGEEIFNQPSTHEACLHEVVDHLIRHLWGETVWFLNESAH